MTNIYDEALDHLIDSLKNPDKRELNQETYNAKRLQDWIDNLHFRPALLPIKIQLPPEVQTLPVDGQTLESKYKIIVTGAMTDGELKQIGLKLNSELAPQFVSVASGSTSQISLDAVAGKSLESGGKNGVMEYFPFRLNPQETIAVQIYKPEPTNGIDVVSIVFVGLRVLSPEAALETFTPELEEILKSQIAKQSTPQPRFAVCDVKFDADGVAETSTPRTGEARFVRGFRTTVKNAMLNLSFNEEEKVARDFAPIWALCAEGGDNTDNFRLLKKAIPLAPGEQLYMTLKNTINGQQYANPGTIEVLQSTI